MSRPLTQRQGQVLNFLHDFQAANERPPTRVEIARNFNWASPNAAEDHLKALQRKGAIRLVADIARGIELN